MLDKKCSGFPSRFMMATEITRAARVVKSEEARMERTHTARRGRARSGGALATARGTSVRLHRCWPCARARVPVEQCSVSSSRSYNISAIKNTRASVTTRCSVSYSFPEESSSKCASGPGMAGPGKMSLGVRRNRVHYLRGCIREAERDALCARAAGHAARTRSGQSLQAASAALSASHPG